MNEHVCRYKSRRFLFLIVLCNLVISSICLRNDHAIPQLRHAAPAPRQVSPQIPLLQQSSSPKQSSSSSLAVWRQRGIRRYNNIQSPEQSSSLPVAESQRRRTNTKQSKRIKERRRTTTTSDLNNITISVRPPETATVEPTNFLRREEDPNELDLEQTTTATTTRLLEPVARNTLESMATVNDYVIASISLLLFRVETSETINETELHQSLINYLLKGMRLSAMKENDDSSTSDFSFYDVILEEATDSSGSKIKDTFVYTSQVRFKARETDINNDNYDLVAMMELAQLSLLVDSQNATEIAVNQVLSNSNHVQVIITICNDQNSEIRAFTGNDDDNDSLSDDDNDSTSSSSLTTKLVTFGIVVGSVVGGIALLASVAVVRKHVGQGSPKNNPHPQEQGPPPSQQE
jgi:hypothetical protein